MDVECYYGTCVVYSPVNNMQFNKVHSIFIPMLFRVITTEKVCYMVINKFLKMYTAYQG